MDIRGAAARDTNTPPFRKTALAAVMAVALGTAGVQAAAAGDTSIVSVTGHIEGGYLISRSDQTPFGEFKGSGQIVDIQPGNAPYFKAGIDLGLANGWDFGLTYSGLRARTASEHVGPVPNSTLYNVLATATTYYNYADAEAEATHDVIDFEAGHHVKLGQADVHLFGGVRFASLSAEVRTDLRYPTTPPATYHALEKRKVDFTGAGPRLGVRATFPIGGSAFAITGSFAGAAIYGSRVNTTSQQQPLGGTIVGTLSTSHEEHRMIYSLDADLGLTWSLNRSFAAGTEITAGYRAEDWLNVNDTRNQSSVNGSQLGDRNADQFFHGPYVRLQYRF